MRFTRARIPSAVRAEARSESITIGGGYFWFYAGVGAFVPFNALYYRSLGFSGMELGLLTALPAIATALTGPIWGMLADSRGWHRQIMRAVLVISVFLILLLAQITTFLPFMLTMTALAFMLVPVPSLWDSYAVSAVERGGAPYGVLRIFGSLGFTSVVLVMGRVLADDLSSTFFYVYAACHVVAFAVAMRLPALSERQQRKMFAGVGEVFAHPAYRLLLLIAFLISAGYTTLNIYLAIHIQSLGGSTSVAGIAFAVSAMSELPVIGFGAFILRRFGARKVIFIALAVYIIRFSAMGFITVTPAVIAAQALHGLSFGMFLIASVTLAHRLVGRQHAATAQALLAVVSMGIGSILGSLVAGVAIDHVSTSTIYKVVALMMGLTMIIFWIGTRRISRDAYDPPPAATA